MQYKKIFQVHRWSREEGRISEEIERISDGFSSGKGEKRVEPLFYENVVYQPSLCRLGWRLEVFEFGEIHYKFDKAGRIPLRGSLNSEFDQVEID